MEIVDDCLFTHQWNSFFFVTGNPSIEGEMPIAGLNEQRVHDRQATPAHVRNWRVFEVEALARNKWMIYL